jgi:hypothetical protein
MEGREGTCLIALIKYLQAALTCLAVDTDPLLAINNALDAPVADGLLLDHHQCILEEDFPQLNMQLASLQQDPVTVNLGELVQDNCRAYNCSLGEMGLPYVL